MADTDRIIHRNLWQVGDFLSNNMLSEHPQFPKEDTTVDSPSQCFRSRHGTGSGNGVFYVYTGNNKINFDEGGGELTATLTNGYYNGQTLATEIKTKLEVAGARTYTVTYDESTAKFSISADGSFTLKWNTGTNKATDISDICGYLDTADDGPGVGPFVSDERRIHWNYEQIIKDLLTAYQYNFIAILNHNLSSDTVIDLYGADDANFSVNLVQNNIAYNANNIYFFLPVARTKRYIQLRIYDRENPSSYWQIGTIFLGNYWEPSRKHGSEYGYGMDEISEGEESDSRAYYGVVSKPRLDTYYFDYQNIDAASRANALDLMDECGIQKAFVFCEDYATPNTYSYYVQNLELFEARGTIKDRCNWALSVKEVV